MKSEGKGEGSIAVKDVRTTTFSPVYPLAPEEGERGREGNRRRQSGAIPVQESAFMFEKLS